MKFSALTNRILQITHVLASISELIGVSLFSILTIALTWALALISIDDTLTTSEILPVLLTVILITSIFTSVFFIAIIDMYKKTRYFQHSENQSIRIISQKRHCIVKGRLHQEFNFENNIVALKSGVRSYLFGYQWTGDSPLEFVSDEGLTFRPLNLRGRLMSFMEIDFGEALIPGRERAFKFSIIARSVKNAPEPVFSIILNPWLPKNVEFYVKFLDSVDVRAVKILTFSSSMSFTWAIDEQEAPLDDTRIVRLPHNAAQQQVFERKIKRRAGRRYCIAWEYNSDT
ncbi:hypothetical protein AB6B38_01890 [Glycocaulis abyssi]|uniref:Uncharacterized protein n=1 Tax=Glycocaulis abyssi TaxID=1433403 RepID=A0ABV9NCW4_9PROT